MNEPTILTIIVNYRTPEMTLRSAEAAVGEMQGLHGEVVIVENGSGDGSLRHISEALAKADWNHDHRARVVDAGRNGGFGAGVNTGIQSGLSTGKRPDFYYLLNSDAFPDRDAIRILLDTLAGNPRIGMAGSYIHGTDGTPHQTAFRFPSVTSEFLSSVHTGFLTRLFSRSVVAMPIPDLATQVDWTAGASLMLRRKMLEEIGAFDEGFFLYYEETDLCRRADRAGWETWYVPASSVAHIGSASTGMQKWQRVPDYWFDSRLRYFRKNHGAFYAFCATMARLLGGTIWKVRQVLTRKPDRDPAHFLSDLLAHDFRALFRPAGRVAAPYPNPLTEESK